MTCKWDGYAYADAAKETKRSSVAENTEHKFDLKSRAADKKRKNSAWSTQKEKKEEKQRRLEKKVLKKKWLASKNADSTAERLAEKRGLDEVDRTGDFDDWEDLAREERLAKRVRKGTVSQQEFNEEFGDLVTLSPLH